MKIDKVYNNNVVLAKGDDGEEIIVMGRGLGFQKKPGDEIDTALVEKTFVMQDKDTTNELTRVYLDLSPVETEVVLDIIKHGQEVLGTTFDTASEATSCGIPCQSFESEVFKLQFIVTKNTKHACCHP